MRNRETDHLKEMPLYYRTKGEIEAYLESPGLKLQWLQAQMEFFYKAMPPKAKRDKREPAETWLEIIDQGCFSQHRNKVMERAEKVYEKGPGFLRDVFQYLFPGSVFLSFIFLSWYFIDKNSLKVNICFF